MAGLTPQEIDEVTPVRESRDEVSLAAANKILKRLGKKLVEAPNPKKAGHGWPHWDRVLPLFMQEAGLLEGSTPAVLGEMRGEIAATLADGSTPLEERVATLYSTTSAAVAAVYSHPSKLSIGALAQFLDAIFPFVLENRLLVKQLQAFLGHEANVYSHCAGTMLHAVPIAHRLGYTEIASIGLAALLHDIGKIMIDQDMLLKPEALTQEEWRQIRLHPFLGAHLLRKCGGTSAQIHTLVSEHHERLDGSGYPLSLGRANLDKLSLVLMVADVYDALVKSTSYRPAYSALEALKLLKDQTAGRIDVEAFRQLVFLVAGD